MLVLVVDDDPVVRRATARLVRHAGHRTVEADGPEALEAIRVDGPIDLVLSDYDMPDISGLDVFEAAAQVGLPFVFHTGNIEAVADTGIPAVAKGDHGALARALAAWEAYI